jgi:hypothetical protein
MPKNNWSSSKPNFAGKFVAHEPGCHTNVQLAALDIADGVCGG